MARVAAALLCALAGAAGAAPPVELGGHVRALAIASRTPDAQARRFELLSTRLRLKLGARLSPSWLATLEHDTELNAGSALDTAGFRAQAAAEPRLRWGTRGTWLDRGDLHGTQRVFRAHVQYSDGATTLTLGRQRVPLGVGRFWSTLDMLNPVNPQAIEREEMVGVDALVAERAFGPLSRALVVFAPDPRHRDDRWVAQWRTHRGGADVTLTAGHYWRDQVAGLDLATQLGDSGLRAELALTRPAVGATYRRLLLGLDHAFSSTLSANAELYLSDRRAADRDRQWAANPQLAQVQPPGRRYLGVSVGYDATPLWKLSLVALANLDDGSRLWFPSVSHSLSDDSVLSGGVQWFSGGAASEYGRGKALGYLRYQRYF